jgi:hypothetical protein
MAKKYQEAGTSEVVRVFLGIIVGLICLLSLGILEQIYFKDRVTPAHGQEIEDWVLAARTCFLLVGGAVMACIVIWLLYALATSGRNGDGRLLWVFLWLIALLTAMFIALFKMPETEGAPLSLYLACVLDAALAYYLATLFGTPATRKYAPIGRRRLP